MGGVFSQHLVKQEAVDHAGVASNRNRTMNEYGWCARRRPEAKWYQHRTMNKYEVCSQSPVKQHAVDQVVPRMEVNIVPPEGRRDQLERD